MSCSQTRLVGEQSVSPKIRLLTVSATRRPLPHRHQKICRAWAVHLRKRYKSKSEFKAWDTRPSPLRHNAVLDFGSFSQIFPPPAPVLFFVPTIKNLINGMPQMYLQFLPMAPSSFDATCTTLRWISCGG